MDIALNIKNIKCSVIPYTIITKTLLDYISNIVIARESSIKDLISNVTEAYMI